MISKRMVLAFVGGHISSKTQKFGPRRPCVGCAAMRRVIGVEQLNDLRELTAFAER